MAKTKFAITTLAALSTLTACSPNVVRENFGLRDSGPDEFAVTRRAPLEIDPTKFANALPKPVLGQQRPQEKSAQQFVRDALTGKDTKTVHQQYASRSAADQAFLGRFGSADTNIRNTLNAETKDYAKTHTPVAQKVYGMFGFGSQQPIARIVDANSEAKRIRESQEKGEALTGSNTPTLQE